MEYWLYKLAGCPERALQDEDWGTRREAYRALGFTEEALKDEAWGIRLEAYRALGFTEEALKDKDPDIRLEAYRALGFTEEALKDEAWGIRREASDYFKAKALLLERYPNLEDMPPLLIGDDKFLKLYAETRLEKGV